MISFDDFIDSAEKGLNLKLNEEQLKIISSPPGNSVKIVAGPGSGKTTVLVMRILKLICVDDANPEEIMATTFTRKAADELKSRILGWGEAIRQYIISSTFASDEIQIENLNFSLVTTGTIDSISEEALRSYRGSNDVLPTTVGDTVLRSLMDKKGYMEAFYSNSSSYQDFENEIIKEIEKMIGKTLCWGRRDKILQFLIDLDERLKENMFSTDRLGDFPRIKECLEKYNNYLEEKLLTDFPKLEQRYYEFIKTRGEDYLRKYKFVFIDEYQDTNRLQEFIFHELMRNAVKNGGSCVVVGDDDQSMYRFRGSHVYLFSDLENRIDSSNVCFEVVYLYRNYRSTPNIVDFYNEFIRIDDKYQKVRIKDKPEITAERKDCVNYPILGMFRNNVEKLSEDLSEFITGLVKNRSYDFIDKKGKKWIIKLGEKGSVADFVILCNSPKEVKDNGDKRMPYFIKEYMQNHSDIKVSNLRGQDFQNVDGVRLICGLILCCIDPLNDYQNDCYIPDYACGVINEWRKESEKFLEENNKTDLRRCVENWIRLLDSRKRKKYMTITDIIYSLLPWIPSLHNDSGGIVYLQTILKTVEDSSYLNSFGGRIIFDKNGCATKSIKSAIEDIFVPIASGRIKIDEGLTNDISDDRLSIMSIHQAKGLEFPITIVDVASEFSTNHWTQRYKRFLNKEDVDTTSKIENFIDLIYGTETNCEREDVDRCFDDLYRKFYVSFSRPQDILLLVGLADEKKGRIPNVAMGWTRNEEWKFEDVFKDEIVHI